MSKRIPKNQIKDKIKKEEHSNKPPKDEKEVTSSSSQPPKDATKKSPSKRKAVQNKNPILKVIKNPKMEYMRAHTLYNEGYFQKAMECLNYAEVNGVEVLGDIKKNTQRAIDEGGIWMGGKNVRPAR